MEKKKQYPKSRLGWLWENMEGKHSLFIVALIGTAVYNVLQLVVPHFSGKLVKLFQQVESEGLSLTDNKSTFYNLIFLMVGLVIGQNVLGSDGWAAGLGVGLLAVGLLIVRLIDKKLGGKPGWKPKLIKVFEEMPHPLNDE